MGGRVVFYCSVAFPFKRGGSPSRSARCVGKFSRSLPRCLPNCLRWQAYRPRWERAMAAERAIPPWRRVAAVLLLGPGPSGVRPIPRPR